MGGRRCTRVARDRPRAPHTRPSQVTNTVAPDVHPGVATDGAAGLRKACHDGAQRCTGTDILRRQAWHAQSDVYETVRHQQTAESVGYGHPPKKNQKSHTLWRLVLNVAGQPPSVPSGSRSCTPVTQHCKQPHTNQPKHPSNRPTDQPNKQTNRPQHRLVVGERLQTAELMFRSGPRSVSSSAPISLDVTEYAVSGLPYVRRGHSMKT